MKLVADIHLHSHYSRATSKNLTLEHLWKWAQIKGVQVVATGDIAHPGWLAEIQEKLEPAEEGLFRLRPEFTTAVAQELPPACQGTVRFLIGGEISNIYKKNDRTRKVHNVVFAPTLEATGILQAELEKIGNIRSDGRPILGLDSRDLLEIVLEVDDRCYLIPAHIWTPWFSVLGSKSGFDSIAECFDDLTPHIFAVETGLSSDPPMNWRVSWLDDYTLVSNSDAHSPPKLAREATLFDTDLSYDALFDALKTGHPAHFRGTIEFFPQEGKYHLDGHRKCGICWEPVTTIAHDRRCTVCGKPVTIGVYHRVEELADRPQGVRPDNAAPFASLIPLPEVLSEILQVGPNSKRVQREYFRLLGLLGSELTILQEAPLEEIASAGGPLLAEGIRRMRAGDVQAQSGFDGEYGVIRLFADEADQLSTVQFGLFANDRPAGSVMEEAAPYKTDGPNAKAQKSKDAEKPRDAEENTQAAPQSASTATPASLDDWLAALNPDQRAAATHTSGPLAIVAGPGTGKTRTLTVRIAHLVQGLRVPPASILAVTFTNKAAQEMQERLADLLDESQAGQLTIQTFHGLGAALLQEFGGACGLPEAFAILDENDRQLLLKRTCPKLSAQELTAAAEAISARKNGLPADDRPPLDETVWTAYQNALAQAAAVDFDDLIFRTVRLLEADPQILGTLQQRFRWISVDEYQDVNPAQYRLLRLLAGGGANLCVIGDPDQAIYGFRGADHRYFLEFEQDFPGADRLFLARNYRSAQAILDAASQVIARNPDRQARALLADFAEQVKLDVYRAPTDKAEAEYVVHQVEQLVGGTSYFSLDSGRVDDDGLPENWAFSDFAVLYRLNAQANLLEEAFDRSGIPYQTVGGPALTEQKPVREILALLWLTRTPASRVHWERLLAEGRGAFAPDAIDELTARVAPAAESGPGEKSAPAVAALESALAGGSWRPAQQERLRRTLALLRALAGADDQPVSARVRQAAEGWADLRGAAFRPAEAERVERLQRRAAPFRRRLGDFLLAMALQSETDGYDPRADRVALLSLHSAKGLEFPVVFVVGCEEGLLPYQPAGSSRRVDLAEERRLFYVGMTRAQRRLILTHAQRRFLFGQAMQNRLSRFVDDIAAALKEVQQARQRPARPQAENLQLPLF